ncbi:MAG: SCP2 sterol-binding domain-containing protein [Burkholderiales bacterium]|nr:SCP2 sterol-binding domain-containing protein [Burkholderiales bacterium]
MSSTIVNRPPFVVPPFLQALLARLPPQPPAIAFAAAMRVLAPRLLDREGLAALSGKSFRIHANDAGIGIAFRIDGSRFTALHGGDPVDTTLRAHVADFVLLALRRIDPDTLFFARRLAIEGDTEAGLLLKNLLDAVDFRAFASHRG